jgi:hypothetical protein
MSSFSSCCRSAKNAKPLVGHCCHKWGICHDCTKCHTNTCNTACVCNGSDCSVGPSCITYCVGSRNEVLCAHPTCLPSPRGDSHAVNVISVPWTARVHVDLTADHQLRFAATFDAPPAATHVLPIAPIQGCAPWGQYIANGTPQCVCVCVCFVLACIVFLCARCLRAFCCICC